MRHFGVFLMFFLFINALAIASTKIDPALRDANGRMIFYEAQTHAIKACAELGKRLPTAREYAVLSATRGSEGILESETKSIPSGFYEVNVVNVGGSNDHFYFSHQGYVEPSDEELRGRYNACYWTGSSEDHVPNLFGHIFNPTFGFVRLFDRPYNFGACAIRCVVE